MTELTRNTTFHFYNPNNTELDECNSLALFRDNKKVGDYIRKDGEWEFNPFLGIASFTLDDLNELTLIASRLNGSTPPDDIIPDVVDAEGNPVCHGDRVSVQLPFWNKRMEYVGEIIYKDGEYRVGKLEDAEHGEPYKNYGPDNYVRLCDLRDVPSDSVTYIPNYGKVPDPEKMDDKLFHLKVLNSN